VRTVAKTAKIGRETTLEYEGTPEKVLEELKKDQPVLRVVLTHGNEVVIHLHPFRGGKSA